MMALVPSLFVLGATGSWRGVWYFWRAMLLFFAACTAIALLFTPAILLQ